MAQKNCRIDNVVTQPDGSLVVEFTVGAGPLPPPAGRQLIFASRQALYQRLLDFEEQISDEDLALLALAQWSKNDQQMSNAALARGKLASLDLTGNGTVVRVG